MCKYKNLYEKEVSDMTALIPVLRRHNWLAGPRREFFDRFFEDFGLPSVFSEETGFSPAFDVSETEDAVTVKAELPGIAEKDIDISFSDGILTIKGEKKHEKEEENACYHTVERHYGTFSRSLRLPTEVDTEKVDATFKDGVLRVTLPKSETSKPRKIEIKN
jgi:HSP20 family protein